MPTGLKNLLKLHENQNPGVRLPDGMTSKSTDELNLIASAALVVANGIIENAHEDMPDGVDHVFIAIDKNGDSAQSVIATCLSDREKLMCGMSAVAFTLHASGQFPSYLFGCANVVGTLPFWARAKCAWMVFKGAK